MRIHSIQRFIIDIFKNQYSIEWNLSFGYMEMVELVKFTLTDAIKNSDYLQQNRNIDPIYIELAEYTLLTLHKIYPFSSYFDDLSGRSETEVFKTFVLVWADAFMTKKMSCKKKINDAIQQILDMQLEYPPSLPQVISAYHGKLEKKDSPYMGGSDAYFYIPDDTL
jgi:hypothetical protein